MSSRHLTNESIERLGRSTPRRLRRRVRARVRARRPAAARARRRRELVQGKSLHARDVCAQQLRECEGRGVARTRGTRIREGVMQAEERAGLVVRVRVHLPLQRLRLWRCAVKALLSRVKALLRRCYGAFKTLYCAFQALFRRFSGAFMAIFMRRFQALLRRC
jgi:hypothetical protein